MDPPQARKRTRSASRSASEQPSKRSRPDDALDVSAGRAGVAEPVGPAPAEPDPMQLDPMELDEPAAANPLAAPVHAPAPAAPAPPASLGHTDYTLDRHGNVRRLEPDLAAMAFMRSAEAALPNATAARPEVDAEDVGRGARGRVRKRERQLETSAQERRVRQARVLGQASERGFARPAPAPAAAGMPTLTEQATSLTTLLQGYRGALSQHQADRSQPFAQVPFPGRPESGALNRSYANQYRLPDWNPSAPGASSAFAVPRGADGRTMETIYNNDAGMFSSARFAAPSQRDVDHQTLLAAAESSRGPGAGLSQLLAHDARPAAGIQSRDEYYGRGRAATSVPGFVPASYSGSQLDIALASRDTADDNRAGVQSNPFAAQVAEVLSLSRRPPLERSRSFDGGAGLFARPQDYEADADAHLGRLGMRAPRPGESPW